MDKMVHLQLKVANGVHAHPTVIVDSTENIGIDIKATRTAVFEANDIG